WSTDITHHGRAASHGPDITTYAPEIDTMAAVARESQPWCRSRGGSTLVEGVPYSLDDVRAAVLLHDPDDEPAAASQHFVAADISDELAPIASMLIAVVLKADLFLLPTQIDERACIVIAHHDLGGRRWEAGIDEEQT